MTTYRPHPDHGRRRRMPSFRPQLEQLLERVVPAFTAEYGDGVLFIVSDDAADTIAVTRSGNMLLINGQQVTTEGYGTAAIDNTTDIAFFGNDGDDVFTIAEDI